MHISEMIYCMFPLALSREENKSSSMVLMGEDGWRREYFLVLVGTWWMVLDGINLAIGL